MDEKQKKERDDHFRKHVLEEEIRELRRYPCPECGQVEVVLIAGEPWGTCDCADSPWNLAQARGAFNERASMREKLKHQILRKGFKVINLRLDAKALAEADELLPVLDRVPLFRGEKGSRSAVLRLAIAIGLAELRRLFKEPPVTLPPGADRQTDDSLPGAERQEAHSKTDRQEARSKGDS